MHPSCYLVKTLDGNEPNPYHPSAVISARCKYIKVSLDKEIFINLLCFLNKIGRFFIFSTKIIFVRSG